MTLRVSLLLLLLASTLSYTHGYIDNSQTFETDPPPGSILTYPNVAIGSSQLVSMQLINHSPINITVSISSIGSASSERGGDGSFVTSSAYIQPSLSTLTVLPNSTAELDFQLVPRVIGSHHVELVLMVEAEPLRYTLQYKVEIPRYAWLMWLLSGMYLIVVINGLLQTMRILMYKHKRLSFQIAFLCLCATWGFLRAIFFVISSLMTYPIAGSIFLWTPMMIQFALFTLLVVYFFALIYQKDGQWNRWFAIVSAIYLFVNFAFSSVVIAYIVFEIVAQFTNVEVPSAFVAFMQGYAGVLFGVLVLLLAFFVFKLVKAVRAKHIPPPSHILRGDNATMWIMVITMVIVIMYLSRTVYDFLTVFDLGSLYFNSGSFWQTLLLVICYVMWEITPVSLVLLLFGRIPTGNQREINETRGLQAQPTYTALANPTSVQSGLFQNPQRYDESDSTSFNSPSSYAFGSTLLYTGTPTEGGQSFSPYSVTPTTKRGLRDDGFQ